MYRLSASVIIIRAGGASQNFLNFFPSQYRKMCQKHPIPYLNTCITYPNTLARLSVLGSISLYMHYLSYYIESAFGSRLHILIHCQLGNHPRQPIRIQHYVTTRELSGPFLALGASRLIMAYLSTLSRLPILIH